jgi:cytochrome c oxidase cbb3-type subunit III
MKAFVVAICLCAIAAAGGCKREERGFRVEPPQAARTKDLSLTALFAGEPPVGTTVSNEYEENAFAMNEGKRLFTWYNCSGCHAHGGGGMGPPLMDNRWIYGGEPQQIFATIVQGRPNGMPSFRGKIPDFQVWQLAAYVRSMSGNVSRDAAPTRNDDLAATTQEQSVPVQPPVQAVTPK